MSQPAARISDLHTCPQQTPMPAPAPPVPHVGGPILPPGEPKLLIGGLPAARVGDLCVCVAPAPDSIVKGSPTVLIGGKPAARMGDSTAHGGVIAGGFPKVLIGDQGSGAGGSPLAGLAQQSTEQKLALKGAAAEGSAFCEICEKARRPVEPEATGVVRKATLKEAAQSGVPFCEECAKMAAEPKGPPPADPAATQRQTLKHAADSGTPFCEECARMAGTPSH